MAGLLIAAILPRWLGRTARAWPGCPMTSGSGSCPARWRMEALAAWTQMAALTEVAGRCPAAGDPAGSASSRRRGGHAFGDRAGRGRADRVRPLRRDPASRTFAALAAGKIHPVDVRIIEDETSILSAADAAAADEELAGAAQSKTFGELRSAAHRLVMKGSRGGAQAEGEGAGAGARAPVPGVLRERGDDRAGDAQRGGPGLDAACGAAGAGSAGCGGTRDAGGTEGTRLPGPVAGTGFPLGPGHPAPGPPAAADGGPGTGRRRP